MAEARNRPLSPHLQIWRWGPAMFTSIPESYATFTGHASAWYGLVVLVGISWSFFNHMASGIRHFVMDIGAGYELDRNALWSVLTPVLGLVLTAAFWAALLLR
jgi:succinate dehydrogenase / fumarate reductase cytochrome b subunit